MPNKFKYHIEPNDPNRPRTVRGAYLYNLVDCIHACILRREHARARRAWAIFVRCPDVNWRDKWRWGLYLLTDGAPPADPQASQSAYSQQERGVEAERYLRSLQVSAHEEDKPSILAELVLHLIHVERYRAAREELETYLVSYPYLLSASLHTYAGLICFYLAQPPSLRGGSGGTGDRGSREGSVASDASASTANEPHPPANQSLLHQAREWFSKALAIDPSQDVAREFAKLIDNPLGKSPLTEDMDLDSVADLADLELRDESGDEKDSEGEGEEDEGYKSDAYSKEDEDEDETDDDILGLNLRRMRSES